MTPPPAPGASKLAEYPTERRVQVLALFALGGAVVLDALLVGFAPVKFIGLEVPGIVPLALVAGALALGVVAVVRRSLVLVAATVAALVLPALSERPWDVTVWRFGGSVAFGFLVLAYGELVHMTVRYEKWHKVADETRTSAEGLDHATEEYLRTFTSVFGLSALLAGVVGAVFFLLLNFGPAQHRASVDFRSMYGLAGAAVLVFGTLVLVALARGADWSIPKRRPRAAADDASPTPDPGEMDAPLPE